MVSSCDLSLGHVGGSIGYGFLTVGNPPEVLFDKLLNRNILPLNLLLQKHFALLQFSFAGRLQAVSTRHDIATMTSLTRKAASSRSVGKRTK